MDLWLKALHIIAVISWMAGLLYLPRLFVYHAESEAGSQQAATFVVMERRLLRAIMDPAMLVVWITGPLLAWRMGMWKDGWLHAKFMLVIGLSAYHHMLALWRKRFERGEIPYPAKTFRVLNEVPTLLMIGIVILVVVKPF
jgi:putative membrane protein